MNYLIQAMQNCQQFDNQTVYEHCLFVQSIFKDLYNKEFKNYKIPEWFIENFD